jgi:transcription antitermination protein NusB
VVSSVKARSRARGWALQALYAWESQGWDPDRSCPCSDQLAETLHVSPRNRLYAEVLVQLVARNLPRIDGTVQKHLTNWSLNRLSVVDRNILRLGVAELMFVDDVPQRVTIREMMRLAEHYGTDESPRFVNGVLDAVMRRINTGGGRRRVRILLVNWQDRLNPQAGGAEIHLHEVFGRLAAGGVEVTLLASSWRGADRHGRSRWPSGGPDRLSIQLRRGRTSAGRQLLCEQNGSIWWWRR